MKSLLIIFLILYALTIVASAVVLVSMERDSRQLWEWRNELEKENKELKERM